MKIEENALQKESDKASKERLEKLSGEIKTLEAKTAELTAQWQAEKDKLAGAQKLKEQLEQARSELEVAQRNGDLNRASELKYELGRASWRGRVRQYGSLSVGAGD